MPSPFFENQHSLAIALSKDEIEPPYIPRPALPACIIHRVFYAMLSFLRSRFPSCDVTLGRRKWG